MNQSFQADAEPAAPHNIEAEQQVLGALLTDNTKHNMIQGLLSPEDFMDPVHAEIFESIEAKINGGVIASPVTLKPTIEAIPEAAALGGPSYLAKLAGGSMSSFAIKDYAEIIVDTARKRDLIERMNEAREEISAGKMPAADVAIQIEAGVSKIAEKTTTKPLTRSHLSGLIGAVSEINDAHMGINNNGALSGIRQLDDVLSGGLRGGQLIVIGGRPAMGKTTVGQNVAMNVAMSGKGVFFGSLEMPAEELARRFLSLGLNMNGHRIPYSKMTKSRAITEDEMRAVIQEAKRQESLPIIVGERDVRHIDKLRAAAKRAKQRLADTDTPLTLIVADYIQLIQSKSDKPYERASAASDGLKSLSMELGVPVVAMAQLSRSVEHRDPAIPMLSDLRESGKLEEDADVVIFAYRAEYYLRKKIEATNPTDLEAVAELTEAMDRVRGQIDLIVDKQRSGATGTARCFSDLPVCRITDDRATHEGYLV